MAHRFALTVLLLGALLGAVGLAHSPHVASSPTPTAAITVPSAPVTAPVIAPKPRWDNDIHATPRTGQFVRYFRMKVTAYTPINTRMEGGRYTVTRRDGRSAHGVAVDPDLIPLGSHLWIPGYGHAIADDIGGRIQGHHIDLRLQDGRRMAPWGVRYARVYVIDDPRGPLSRLADTP